MGGKMFFISWGAHGELAQVGESEIMNCSRCEMDNRDVAEGKTSYPGYYRPERLKLDKASLSRMQVEGVIFDVER
jgi:hypothetical protein